MTNEGPIDLEKRMESMIQCQNNYIQSQNDSFNWLKAQMSRLINIVNDRNEKTLPNTFLTILDCPSHIDRDQESWCLGDFNQDSIGRANCSISRLTLHKICLAFECTIVNRPTDRL